MSRVINMLRPGGGPGVSLPEGLSPQQFCERSDKMKPRAYSSIVEQALRYYWGLAQDDTLWALRRAFPKTADYMTPVSVPIIEYVIKKQAAVFSGDPAFELVDHAGQTVEAAGGAQWKDIVTAAELQRHLQQMNRLTRLCKRSFVRVTWDARRKRVHLVTFTPDKVHVLFPPDSRDLNDATGVLLDIEPALIGESVVRRWEFWCAGKTPRNFIIDEAGRVTGVPDESGKLSFGNPYVNDRGEPIVPIVSFADEDVSVGYWLLPRQSLVGAQQAIDVDQTTLKYVMRLQGFGQWVSEVQAGERQPEDWAGEPTRGQNAPVDSRSGLLGLWGRNLQRRGDGDATVTMGPDIVLSVPRGRKLVHIPQEARITEQVTANDRFLKQVLTAESVPPGEMLGEPQRQSGYALQVERLSLTELRADQVALYQRPTEELITLVRLLWDAHQPDDTTRFGPLHARFRAGEMTTPIDPATQNATDAFELQWKLASRAQIVARRNDVSLDEARALLAEADGVAATPGAPEKQAPPISAPDGGDATEPDPTRVPPDAVLETPAADPSTGGW